MFNLLKKLFTKATPFTRSEKSGDDLTPWEKEQIAKGFCPDCEHKDTLMEGPRGGLSVNVRCSYCGNKFNIVMLAEEKNTAVFGERIADRTIPSDRNEYSEE
jgi:hypothetical protein